jgi:hypothetical protein
MITSLEYIKSKITYPIDIYEAQTIVKGTADNMEAQIEKLQNSKVVVIGDLHGNINKALETIILANLIEIKADDLNTFYELFEHPDSYTDMNKIIVMVKALRSVKWVDVNRKMIFLRDILADRVGNDITALIFFDILRNNGAIVETIIGNHDHACDFIDRTNAQYMNTYAISFFNACDIFDNSDVDLQQYCVKLLNSFIIDSKLIIFDKINKTLFVHAPIRKLNFTTAINLLKKLELIKLDFVLKNETIEEFCDKLNQFYIDYRLNNKYQDKKYIIENKLLKSVDASGNRKSEGWFWVGEHWFDADHKFYTNLGIKIIVHGHDIDSQKSTLSPLNRNYNPEGFTVINLDNMQGKDMKFAKSSSSIYI